MSHKKEGDSSSSETNSKKDYVKWFSELNKNSGKVAGGKGANLAEIYNIKMPVPPGFVVTAQAYDYFIKSAEIDKKIKEILSDIDYEDTKQLEESAKKIRELIINSKMPEDLKEEIVEAYETLNTEGIEEGKYSAALDILKKSEPLFVAVRSSATTEDLAEASFAGQQESYVNVKGNIELLTNIKKCQASLFTARAIYYRNKQGFKDIEASLAVVVQKMIDSDKSGVIFSKDPSYNNDNIIIEAVYGLGEGIVSGIITPDKYIVSRNLEIIEKKIENKKLALTRDSGGKKITVKLKEERAKSKVLTDFEIKKLAEYALKLEDHYKKPQDIEFAIEAESIYLVQTRPITTMNKRFDSVKEIKGEVILKGTPASPGIGFGIVKIVKTMSDLDKIRKGDILVTEMTNPDMVVTMQKSSAIVTDEGGMTSHAAIVSREMGIPCIVGTQEATKKLKDGEIITVDGFTGKVYKGKVSDEVEKEVLPVEVKTRTKIKVMVDIPSFAKRASKTNLKSVGLVRIEGIIAESGKHPNYFIKNNKVKEYEEVVFKGVNEIAEHFDELWVRTSDIRSDEFKNLEGASKTEELNPMLGMHGIRYGIKNPLILKAEINALKRVSEKDKKIGVLLPQVISVEEVKKVKEVLEELDFRDAQLGVMVETPAATQIIRELCEEGIDFISFGTNDLTQFTLAIDRGNEQVQYLYDEMHPAVLNEIKYVIRNCKRFNVETSICGQAGSKKEMVKFLVENGIDSISVNADAASEIAEYVSELEKSSNTSQTTYTQPRYQNERNNNQNRQNEKPSNKHQEHKDQNKYTQEKRNDNKNQNHNKNYKKEEKIEDKNIETNEEDEYKKEEDEIRKKIEEIEETEKKINLEDQIKDYEEKLEQLKTKSSKTKENNILDEEMIDQDKKEEEILETKEEANIQNDEEAIEIKSKEVEKEQNSYYEREILDIF